MRSSATPSHVDIWYKAIEISNDEKTQEQHLLARALEDLESTEVVPSSLNVFESWGSQPHRFFFFDYQGATWVGRKLISPIVTEQGSPGLFCSLIRPEMLLGPVRQIRTSQEGVRIFYSNTAGAKKRIVFQDIATTTDTEIYFAFNQLSGRDRTEVNTPAEGWFITEERATILGKGETHFRSYSAQLLLNDQVKNAVIYDPACSTGQFLFELKKQFPFISVYGQDLSEQMCNYARKRIENVEVGSSLSPCMPDQSCDYIFFRFLNAEVVASSAAHELFDRIVKCLKPRGKAILFGHTPVLVPALYWESQGYRTLQRVAALPDASAIFPYYVIQKDLT